MIGELVNLIAGGHSFGAGGVASAPGDLTQIGEDFPQLPRLGIPIPPAINLDQGFRQRGLTPPLVSDQGSIRQCTAEATAWACTDAAVGILPTGNPPAWRRFSADTIFALSKTAVVGANPDPKYGSTLVNAARAVRDFGVIPGARLPGGDFFRPDPKRIDVWLRYGVPDWVKRMGQNYQFEIFRVNNHPDQIREALAARMGVVVGVPWTFIRTDKNGMAILTPGTHAMSLAGRLQQGPTGKPVICLRQSYGARMFAQTHGRPPMPWNAMGYGLVPEDVLFDAVFDRRMALAFRLKGGAR